MKKITFLFALTLYTAKLFAQTQYALVIGVDKYNPPAGTKITGNTRSDFPDLQGCRNDAMSIKSIIQTRYGFKANNITELYDEKATREGILSSMKALLAKAQKGNIVFIYYAGHGSQQVNSLSKEEDKRDESMVPSDTWKEGIGDIRDKEQAAIYNAFLDKGVKLTVILDCCHSGSMSRGPVFGNERKRYIAANNYDAKDASNPAAPELRESFDFLLISAAQDFESAVEQLDDQNMPHGAFTLALLGAMQQQSVNAQAINIFKSAHAILKGNGKKQEPVIAGSKHRQSQTLFGLDKSKLEDKTLIPVRGIKKGQVEISGGFAEGLYREHELTLLGDTNTVIRVETVTGISTALCSVKKGKLEGIKPGAMFEVSNWISSDAPLLKIYIPETAFTEADVMQLAKINSQLKSSGKAKKWINNLQEYEPSVSLYFSGNKFLANNGTTIAELKGRDLTAVTSAVTKNDTVFFNLPASAALTAAVKKSLGTNKSISVVTDPSSANYILYGTITDDGSPSYGFLRAQVTSRDSLEAMPLQTKNFNIKTGAANVADSLLEYAMRLSKINGWMKLSGPSDSKGNAFPFHLEVINAKTKQKITTGIYKVGDEVSVHLVADENYNSINVAPKYVYVFGIDKNGSMFLFYPGEGNGNVENKIPSSDTTDIELFGYDVEEPVGTDNLYLLATADPIQGYAYLFNQEGVRDIKQGSKGGDNPLADLLNMGNTAGTRSFKKTPATWNIKRVPIKTTH
ncbi:hypothetical protein EOD41_14330 [Mucilaginibacter limnophilus]|uniref:Peptidase C14 caspase domain-containing protein n=1 Tax=Mucilaginibacter limnophilus TaxID=1932778 RepID=A0A437MR94_9SPHI|nr:caspase family protein [Mucilaginibacter limnophilus]RVU00133.1 hypothetical protein EOD41_14330 [Mucilaginibacter limnophilus]